MTELIESDFQPNVPAWLNLDAIVPAEMRERIPACMAAARKVLDALLDFTDEWGEYVIELEQRIWKTSNRIVGGANGDSTAPGDGWGPFLEEVVGTSYVDHILGLVSGGVEVLIGENPGASFDKLVETSATPDQQERLRSLGDLRGREFGF
jgi:hypothetical protein